MLFRGIQSRLRTARSDRGSNVVELAVLAPALMLMCMLILRFGLWFNAREAALAAAQAGALVGREEATRTRVGQATLKPRPRTTTRSSTPSFSAASPRMPTGTRGQMYMSR